MSDKTTAEDSRRYGLALDHIGKLQDRWRTVSDFLDGLSTCQETETRHVSRAIAKCVNDLADIWEKIEREEPA